jgi:hypothetical protein
LAAVDAADCATAALASVAAVFSALDAGALNSELLFPLAKAAGKVEAGAAETAEADDCWKKCKPPNALRAGAAFWAGLGRPIKPPSLKPGRTWLFTQNGV